MKKLIFLVLAAATVGTASAQLTWDARVGANVSQFTGGGDMLKFGLRAGVTADYAFSELFSLRPGIFFSMKGSSKDGDFAFKQDDAYNLSYIEVPVYAVFRLVESGNFGLRLGAGPYAAFLLNKSKALDPKKFDAGVGAMLDFSFGRFSFGPEVTYGFTKLNGVQKNNICYSLMFGYKF